MEFYTMRKWKIAFCHIQDPDDDEVQVVGDLFIRKT